MFPINNLYNALIDGNEAGSQQHPHKATNLTNQVCDGEQRNLPENIVCIDLIFH